MTKNFGEKNGFIWNFFDSFMLCFDRWDKPINPTDSNTTLNLSVRLILHLQSKCQTNISLSNATFLTSLSLTKYQSSTLSHIQSICYNCNGPLLWNPWPFRSSNLIGQHLVKFGHFCSALVGQNCLLISLSKNMTECTKHGRKKHEKTSSIKWPDIIFVIFSPHKFKAKTA